MLSCEYHDYIEIVCMFQYPIELTLTSGEVVCGVAIDTVRNDANAECIKLKQDNLFIVQEIEQIKVLEVTIQNPHVQRVSFR